MVEQALRGVCFEVVDAKIHRDAPHRGAAQVCPMTRRALSAAFLSAQPVLVEPVYAVQVSLPNHMLKKAFPVLAATSGEAFSQLQFGGWQRVPGDLYEASSDTCAVVTDMRVAKKLKAQLPTADDFWDRL